MQLTRKFILLAIAFAYGGTVVSAAPVREFSLVARSAAAYEDLNARKIDDMELFVREPFFKKFIPKLFGKKRKEPEWHDLTQLSHNIPQAHDNHKPLPPVPHDKPRWSSHLATFGTKRMNGSHLSAILRRKHDAPPEKDLPPLPVTHPHAPPSDDKHSVHSFGPEIHSGKYFFL
jgi:hypothetical protein